jgi:hypothetical protein
MALQVQYVAGPEATAPLPQPATSDERWAAWQAKGVAHDRAVRRKMAIAMPMAILVVAVILYALIGR